MTKVNKAGGGLFSNSTKYKDDSVTVIKFILYLILVRNSLYSFQSFVNNNEHNSYNILLQMIKGKKVWRDSENDMTIYFKKYYNKVVESNGFYNIFPQNYSYYEKLASKALKINTPKKGGSPNKKTKKKTQQKTISSYNNYLKKKKQVKTNTPNSDKLDKELSILFRYVYIALYLKYNMIKYLRNKYYTENKLRNSRGDMYKKLNNLLLFYRSFTSGSQYLASKYIKEIEYITDEINDLFKSEYGLSILKSNLIDTIKQGLNIDIDNLFEVKMDLNPVNILHNELDEYDRLVSFMEGYTD
jgi:hypothetical protein